MSWICHADYIHIWTSSSEFIISVDNNSFIGGKTAISSQFHLLWSRHLLSLCFFSSRSFQSPLLLSCELMIFQFSRSLWLFSTFFPSHDESWYLFHGPGKTLSLTAGCPLKSNNRYLKRSHSPECSIYIINASW